MRKFKFFLAVSSAFLSLTFNSYAMNEEGEDSTSINPRRSLTNLSDELLVNVFGFLDPKELGRLALVNLHIKEISEDNILWSKFLDEEDKTEAGSTSYKKFFVNSLKNPVWYTLTNIGEDAEFTLTFGFGPAKFSDQYQALEQCVSYERESEQTVFLSAGKAHRFRKNTFDASASFPDYPLGSADSLSSLVDIKVTHKYKNFNQKMLLGFGCRSIMKIEPTQTHVPSDITDKMTLRTKYRVSSDGKPSLPYGYPLRISSYDRSGVQFITKEGESHNLKWN